LNELGFVLDESKNVGTRSVEQRIDHSSSRSQIWVIPTNEELIVARQTVAALTNQA
jgi:acetate kinase